MENNILLQEALSMQDDLVSIRRHLHRHPETGLHLKETKNYVKKELLSMGYEPEDCGTCGLTALIGGTTPGKTFLIRGDMDALPFPEETDLDFRSQTNAMHACGHDMHTAMMLGAARLLKSHEHEIHGTIKLMFQPGEEIFEGSKDMIADGVLEHPHVDAAMMLHVMTGLPIPTGTAIVCTGGVSAPAADYFTIQIQGKGCHGSTPCNGVDPINIAAHIITALQEIHARELGITDNAALTFGTIHGGTAPNAIPDIVELAGTIRTYDEELRSYLKNRVVEIAECVAATFRGTAKVIWGSGCPTLINDPALAESTIEYTRELLGTKQAFSTSQLSTLSNEKNVSKTTGSEDFAYISQKVPSIMISLAAGNSKEGYHYPLHHPKVTFDEKALSYGSAIYAYVALHYLSE